LKFSVPKDTPVLAGHSLRVVTLRDVRGGAPADFEAGVAICGQPGDVASQHLLFVGSYIEPQTGIGWESGQGFAGRENNRLADAHHAYRYPGGLGRRGIAQVDADIRARGVTPKLGFREVSRSNDAGVLKQRSDCVFEGT